MAIVTASTTKNIVRVHLRRVGVVAGASSSLVVKVGTPRLKVIAVSRRGLRGADGVGGIVNLAEDPNPTLGGDLILGSYSIHGILDDSLFTLDGGLIEG